MRARVPAREAHVVEHGTGIEKLVIETQPAPPAGESAPVIDTARMMEQQWRLCISRASLLSGALSASIVAAIASFPSRRPGNLAHHPGSQLRLTACRRPNWRRAVIHQGTLRSFDLCCSPVTHSHMET